MTAPVHSDLLAEIDRYLSRHGLSKTQFGYSLMGDPRLVTDLEKGRELRRSTEARLRQKMKNPPPPMTAEKGAA